MNFRIPTTYGEQHQERLAELTPGEYWQGEHADQITTSQILIHGALFSFRTFKGDASEAV